MDFLTRFAHSKFSWLTLATVALTLELCALFFQYVMHLNPCVMCIYQRLAIFGLMAAGIIGALGHQWQSVRIVASIIWAVSAIWGLKIAVELVDIQNNPSPFATCSFLPQFPSWMPLHEWLPSVFLPTGMCGDSTWEMLGVTMSQWMVVVFSGFIIALVLFAWPAFKKNQSV